MSRPSARFWRVWRRNLDAFLKYFHVNLIGNLGDPVLYLLAMGFGLGSYMGDLQGVPYVQFLAPGIIVSAAMFAATYECTYMSFLKMVHLKTYDAIIATPVNVEDVVLGDIAWGASKALFSGAMMFAVTAAFGLVQSWWALLVIPLILAVGFLFASLAMLVTTLSPNFDFFSYYLDLAVTPLFFFSGVFFPLDRFPGWLRAAAFCSPLAHAVSIARSLLLGHRPPHPFLGAALLIIPAVILCLASMRRMRTRLIR